MVEFLITPSKCPYEGWYVNISKLENKTLLIGIVGNMASSPNDRGLYLYSPYDTKIIGVDII